MNDDNIGRVRKDPRRDIPQIFFLSEDQIVNCHEPAFNPLICNRTLEKQNLRVVDLRSHVFVRYIFIENNAAHNRALIFASARNLFNVHKTPNVHGIGLTEFRMNCVSDTSALIY